MRQRLMVLLACLAVLSLSAAAGAQGSVAVDVDHPQRPIRQVTTTETQAIRALMARAVDRLQRYAATRQPYTSAAPEHVVARSLSTPSPELWVTSVRLSDETFRALSNGRVRYQAQAVLTYQHGPPCTTQIGVDVAVAPDQRVTAVLPYDIDQVHRETSTLERPLSYW